MRKRWVLLWAALCLLVPGPLSGAAAERDARLAAAFEGDALTLVEAPLMQDPAGYTLRARAAHYQAVLKDSLPGAAPAYSADGAYVTLALGDMTPFAAPKQCFFSPDGGKALCMDSQNAYVVEGDTITLVSYSPERSVRDEYGQYAAFAKMPPDRWVGAEGVAWSPDGRYAVLTNYAEALLKMRFVYGLYIIDTGTGELFCADTYPTKLQQKGGVVLQACFDGAGRKLYYMVSGPVNEDTRVSLMCYDMETGRKQRLLACQNWCAYPRLQWDGNGNLLNLTDTTRTSDPLGLNVFTQRDGAWSEKSYALLQPTRIAYPTYFEAGPAGFCVLLDRILPANKGNSVTMAGLVRLEKGYPGLGEILLIDSPDAPYATRLSLLNYGDGSILDGRLAEGKLWICLNIKLSPDGRYALLLVWDRKEAVFLMMDVETLALRRVKAPEGAASLRGTYGGAPSAQYPSGYNWFAGNRLVVLTEAGLKCYAFVQ